MPYSERFTHAFHFAASLHRNQVRKGTTTPYITHLMAVASLVGEQTNDEDVAIAALLHDAVEDQGGPKTRAVIADRFGERVATLVDCCTDTDIEPKPPWKPRKQAYLSHLADPYTPPEACLISAADKLHNARCLVADLRRFGMASLEKFNAPPTDLCWYYESVAEILTARLPESALVQELGRTVKSLSSLIAEKRIVKES